MPAQEYKNRQYLIYRLSINHRGSRSNAWWQASEHEGRGEGRREGRKQAVGPLFLWGFSWPGGSPGTWEPESSSESHYTDITSWPEQSADVGAGEWMILAVWGDGVLGGRAQAAWNSMIHPALQRKPVVAQRCQEMGRLGELLRRWQQNRPLLTWGQACQHLSPWGSPPESPGGASALLAQAIQRATDRKHPANFWQLHREAGLLPKTSQDPRGTVTSND